MDFNKRELEILKFWQKKHIFQKTLETTKNGPEFVFYDGPITVNAQPGIHHVLARVYKDIIPRYKTMQGFHVRRKNGWDTHGLPVELSVEKKLGFTCKKDIENYGIGKFNQECQKTVESLIPVFRQITERIAYWVDMDNPYITYKPEYIETLWFILKQAWDKKLLYKDFKIVPWCFRCGTALSSHEVALGYKNIHENSVYIKLKLNPNQKVSDISLPDNAYILSWTTTPWTLPGNVALAVGPQLSYVLVKKGESFFVLAKSRLEILKDHYEVVAEFQGTDLEGLSYQPIFDIPKLQTAASHKIYQGSFVTQDEGTGIVHIAPMYGADDFELGSQHNLPKVHTVDLNGKFNDLVKGFSGLPVKDTLSEKKLLAYLEQKGVLFEKEHVKHDYPFCWRCKSPLLYYAKESWFIKMTALKDQLAKANQKVNWMPSHLKNGRFGEWLKNVKDWAISRERYWGTPLPLWQCVKCGNQVCVGSLEELKKYAPEQPLPENLHRPYIDEIKIKCNHCGSEMKREPYVVDVWFDSGAMPFAQDHWPFAEKKYPNHSTQKLTPPKLFPADYISEAIDQTRGWFYTLLATSVMLGFEAPYKNILCLGHVLDKKGEKMSKSKGNIVVPETIIEKYGADALRWYFFTANQPEDPKRFEERAVKKAFQSLLLLENIYNFLSFYASGFQAMKEQNLENIRPRHTLDRWLKAKNKALIQEVASALDRYQIVKAARVIEGFLKDISYKYIHWSRDRLKDNPASRQEALQVFVAALLNLSKVLAPFIPFAAERAYLKLFQNKFIGLAIKKESVHLEAWPKSLPLTQEEKEIISSVQSLEKIISLGLRARKSAKIKVRQPLSEMRLNLNLKNELLEIARNELNVKKISFQKSIKKEKGWLIDQEEGLKISFNTTLTKNLLEEGAIRELKRYIQIERKKLGLMPGDQIELQIASSHKEVLTLIKKHQNYLQSTSNIESFVYCDNIEEDSFQQVTLLGEKLNFRIKKL